MIALSHDNRGHPPDLGTLKYPISGHLVILKSTLGYTNDDVRGLCLFVRFFLIKQLKIFLQIILILIAWAVNGRMSS